MNNEQPNQKDEENSASSGNQKAESKGTQNYNGYDKKQSTGGSGSGSTESINSPEKIYEGGNLGTAGSGGLNMPETNSSLQDHGNEPRDATEHMAAHESSEGKVPIPVVEDNYQGGNLGTAGSGGMDIQGSESSLSVHALDDEHTISQDEQPPLNELKNPHGLGTGPASSVPDGSTRESARQPKEHTGKDTEMGGATGGTSGMGSGNSEASSTEGKH